MQGTSAGAKDQEADNFLEKKVKGMAGLSLEEAVQTAIGALQNVLSEDFKASQLQVGSLLCTSFLDSLHTSFLLCRLNTFLSPPESRFSS